MCAGEGERPMAKGDKKSASAPETNGEQEEKKVAPPAGFRRRGAVAEAPWFKNKDGNLCYGKLLGRFIMTGVEPMRAYYQVELFKPATVTIGKGDEAEEVTAEAGDVVNVGESFKLECLKDVEIPEILAGGEYDLWIHTKKKIKIGGGRTMWVIDVETKMTKKPTSEVRPLPPDGAKAESEKEGEEAPF